MANLEAYRREKGGKMRVFIVLGVFLVLFGCSGAAKGLINPELTLLKANEDVNAVKVGELKAELAAIKGNVDANNQIATGSGNEISRQTAGRDLANTETNTNDTKLMMYIIKALSGLCTTLIGILGWSLKTLIKRGKEKSFYKEQAILKTNTEDDLMKMRELHDKYIKGGNKK